MGSIRGATSAVHYPLSTLHLNLFYCDSFNLDEHAHGEALHGEGGAGGAVGVVILGVDLVHGLEILHVSQQAGALHHILEGVAGLVEDGLDVLHHLLGLGGNAFGHRLGGGVDGNLARNVEGVAGLNGLAVGSDSRGALGVLMIFFML